MYNGPYNLKAFPMPNLKSIPNISDNLIKLHIIIYSSFIPYHIFYFPFINLFLPNFLLFPKKEEVRNP